MISLPSPIGEDRLSSHNKKNIIFTEKKRNSGKNAQRNFGGAIATIVTDPSDFAVGRFPCCHTLHFLPAASGRLTRLQ